MEMVATLALRCKRLVSKATINKASLQDSKDPDKSYPTELSLKTNSLGLGMRLGLP